MDNPELVTIDTKTKHVEVKNPDCFRHLPENGEKTMVLVLELDEIAINEIKARLFPAIRDILADSKARSRGEQPKKRPCGCPDK